MSDRIRVLAAWFVLVGTSFASTGGSPVAWQPGFAEPDFDNVVMTSVVFDDGGGEALYVGGRFLNAAGVPAERVAKIVGDSVTPLGSGLPGSGLNDVVNAMTGFDDGSGTKLYVGGSFKKAGAVNANRIARWNGTSWSALGAGLNGPVYALAVWDDGSGPALFVGGGFTTAGGQPANRIAKWNGTSWSALGSGVDGVVRTMCVFDDGVGHGPKLFVGGEFGSAGGGFAYGVARWWAGAWTPLAEGGVPGVLSGFGGGWVHDLEVADFGNGKQLYAAGSFSAAGTHGANNIARWNGTAWSTLGGGFDQPVHAIAIERSGVFAKLYAVGEFTTADAKPASRSAVWNGTKWSALGAGLGVGSGSAARTAQVFDFGSGPRLYVGGDFFTAGGLAIKHFARWSGAAWQPVGKGFDGEVFAMRSSAVGGAPRLYCGGTFTKVGGTSIPLLAQWDGLAWSAVGGGVGGDPLPAVYSFTEFDDGTGPALYVGGSFKTAGGVAVSNVARWNGTNWSALGSGLDDQVRALLVHDDGTGPALYAGGRFTLSGSSPTPRIAKWTGTAWVPVGGGADNWVYALISHDDGSGSQLYAGGGFTSIGGAAANRVARWNGSTWSAVGSGTNGFVNAFERYDSGLGGGMQLYAGGQFTLAGVSALRIAKWNGLAWSAVGGGMDQEVRALRVFDDGSGSRLYAAGTMTLVGGIAMSRIARWNGTTWSALGSGLNSTVGALAVHDPGLGNGASLFVGGAFTTSGGLGAGRLAVWGEPIGPTALSDKGSSLAGAGGAPGLDGVGCLVAGTPASVNLTYAAPSAPAVLFVGFSSTPVPFLGGTLLPFPVAGMVQGFTSNSGAISIPFVVPFGVPSGIELWMQYAVQDAGGPAGVALSNALLGVTP